MESRRDPRFRTRFDALCSAGREEGGGSLVNISRSGARLEQTSLRPELGSKVRLYLVVRPVSPLELVGEVVRHTDSGFAVAIIEAGGEIRELIDDLAAGFPPNVLHGVLFRVQHFKLRMQDMTRKFFKDLFLFRFFRQ